MGRPKLNYGGMKSFRIREEEVKKWLDSLPKGYVTELINTLLEKEMRRVNDGKY